jgi:hypothetical protein
MNKRGALLCVVATSILGCASARTEAGRPCSPAVGAPPPSAPAASAPVSAAPFTPSAPIDEAAVAAATGVDKPERSADGVVKVTWPRKDVDVTVDGWKMPPFMGLTSWASFSPGRRGVAEAMVMGDLVLFEDEVNPVMSSLLDGGLQVTALHNHFFFDSPGVYFMHIGGEGSLTALATATKQAQETVAALRKKAPKPSPSFGGGNPPQASTIDPATLDRILDAKGQGKDGMYKAVWGREVTASCGCPAGKAMGVTSWAAFAGGDTNAIVDGDLAVAEVELQPVLKALRRGGVNVVAIHHHMSGEEPRLLFVHYWGRGKVTELASVVKQSLDQTSWAGSAKAAPLASETAPR